MNHARVARSPLSSGASRLILAATALALIIGAMWLAANRADRRLRAELLRQARMVAMSLDQQRVTALSGTEADLAAPDYQRIKEQLALTRSANPDCRFLYLMRRGPDGVIILCVDSEAADSKDYSPPGQSYDEAPSILRDVFSGGQEAVRGPYTDRWGTWISAFVPLPDPGVGGGQTMLGMDIGASRWKWSVASQAATPAALAATAVLLGLLAAVLYWSTREARARQNELETLLQKMINAFVVFDAVFDERGEFVSYRFVTINDAYERITGVKNDEVRGKTVHEVWPGTEPSWVKAYGEVAMTGISREFDMYHEPTAKLYHCCVYRPSADENRFCVIFEDITERKRDEEARFEALARFSGFAEASQYGMGMADMDGRILFANSTLVRMLGETSSTECLGKHFPAAYYPPLMARRLQEKDMPALMRDGHWHGELELLTADGRCVPTDENYFIIRDEQGQPRYIADILTDITDRKREEAERERLQAQFTQAQKMESVGRLAGGVAHDFNNLLMGIMNYVELCRDELPSDHTICSYLDEITKDAQRSANLTRQLLAFARKQTIAPKVLDLNDTVASMLKLLRRLIGEDVDLAWMPGPNLHPVKLDPGQIDQLLANLCVNAKDAIGGVGKVTIETANATLDAAYCAEHADAVPGAYVLLAVSDDGCGMDRETLENIFEPFFTTKGVGEGTGLGLATVYGIVKQNNGTVDVTSEPGKGTTFRIHLPQFAGAGATSTAAEAAAIHPGGNETILLVEDEKSVRVTARLLLEGLGYTVLAAETTEQALDLIADHTGDIHLLITDVVMPGMSGRDLAKQLTTQLPEMRCLFMSGYTADVIAHCGILDEGVAFLPKPFNRATLARKVREMLA